MKVELMERRMETVKKQADAITDLENELSKARKQERAYEEAMEQLQADLDALEQDNAKLKTIANNPERQGERCAATCFGMTELSGRVSVYNTSRRGRDCAHGGEPRNIISPGTGT